MSTRTTVVLDEDVLERVREKAREDDVPFRTTLNDLVREGLAKSSAPRQEKFRVKAFDMGEFLLPFPIKLSDIDAREDEEKMRRLG
jgi:hypothetical protein